MEKELKWDAKEFTQSVMAGNGVAHIAGYIPLMLKKIREQGEKIAELRTELETRKEMGITFQGCADQIQDSELQEQGQRIAELEHIIKVYDSALKAHALLFDKHMEKIFRLEERIDKYERKIIMEGLPRGEDSFKDAFISAPERTCGTCGSYPEKKRPCLMEFKRPNCWTPKPSMPHVIASEDRHFTNDELSEISKRVKTKPSMGEVYHDTKERIEFEGSEHAPNCPEGKGAKVGSFKCTCGDHIPDDRKKVEDDAWLRVKVEILGPLEFVPEGKVVVRVPTGGPYNIAVVDASDLRTDDETREIIQKDRKSVV